MPETAGLCAVDRRDARRYRMEKHTHADLTIAPKATCALPVRSVLLRRHSPRATRSWRWRKRNVDSLCLVRDADSQALRATRTERFVQPQEAGAAQTNRWSNSMRI